PAAGPNPTSPVPTSGSAFASDRPSDRRNHTTRPMTKENAVASADPGSTAASLVAGVKALDPTAWRQLVTLYGPLIYGWARRAGLRGEDAADVTQDVFRAVAAGA